MKIYSLITCTLLVLAANAAHAQKNLIYNSGFEDDLYGWDSNDGAKTTPWDFKSGKSSCAIISTNAANWMGIDQVVRIPKKAQALNFSAWLKSTNVVKGKDDWDGAIFSIEFLDGGGKKIGDDVNIATLTGDQPWTQFKKDLKVPANAGSFKILLAMGYATGTMLVDDVTANTINIEDFGK